MITLSHAHIELPEIPTLSPIIILLLGKEILKILKVFAYLQ